MELGIIFIKLFLTFILALIFGLERQRSHKPVGFGTFIFVAVGSCSLSIIAMSISPDNPLPLLGAIVTGIGFLGAGALIKTTDKIFGFTTAASIWLFAILGVCIGTGYYHIGIIIYSFVWVCLFIDTSLEKKGIGSYQKKLNLKINNLKKEEEITNLFRKFRITKYKLLSKSVNKKEKSLSVKYLLEGSGRDIRGLIEEFEKVPYFVSFSLE